MSKLVMENDSAKSLPFISLGFLLMALLIGINCKGQSSCAYHQLVPNSTIADEGTRCLTTFRDQVYVCGSELDLTSGNLECYILEYDSCGVVQSRTDFPSPTNTLFTSMGVLSDSSLFITATIVDTTEGAPDTYLLEFNITDHSFDTMVHFDHWFDDRFQSAILVGSDIYIVGYGAPNDTSHMQSLVFKYNLLTKDSSFKYLDFGKYYYTNSILALSDSSGFIISGRYYDLGYFDSFCLFKVDTGLNLVWNREIPKQGYQAGGMSIEFPANTITTIGYTSIDPSETNTMLIQYDFDGTALRDTTVDYFPNTSEFLIFPAHSRTEQELIIAGGVDDSTRLGGFTSPNILVMSINEDLEMIWQHDYTLLDGRTHDYAVDFSLDSQGNIIIAGYILRFDSLRNDGVILKLDSTGCLPSCYVGIDDNSEEFDFRIWSNPTDGRLNVVASSNQTFQFEVKDLLGKLASSGEGRGHRIIDLSTLNSGVYFIQLKIQDKVWSRKIILDD